MKQVISNIAKPLNPNPSYLERGKYVTMTLTGSLLDAGARTPRSVTRGMHDLDVCLVL